MGLRAARGAPRASSKPSYEWPRKLETQLCEIQSKHIYVAENTLSGWKYSGYGNNSLVSNNFLCPIT